MNIGVSTACLYPMLSEKSFELLAKNGIKNCEIFLNDETEAEDIIIKKFNEIKKIYNTNIISLHSCFSVDDHFMLFSDYERRLNTGLEKYKKLFFAASKLNAKYVVFHGNRRDRSVSSQRYFEVFNLLNQEAKSYGVKILQENVTTTQCYNPLFLKEMIDNFGDDVSFTFDIKQSIRSGYDPFKFYQIIKNNIKHIHINDNNSQFDCLLPGFGNFDFSAFINLIKENNYNGSLIIEVYRNNFKNIDEIIKSYNLMKKYIKGGE
ncbi:MAG: sugar phosphate isomerase/epimerase [Oscillospiraceae bacterium]